MNIQWYPGHMTRTRRQVAAQLKNVDAVAEILDARIPRSSRNPDIDDLTAGKPRIVVLCRADQAEPAATDSWCAHFQNRGLGVLECNARDGSGTERFAPLLRRLLAEKLHGYAQRGMTGRVVRVMVLGIPNVGKSTFINRLAGRRAAKAEDRPGVTRAPQWVPVAGGVELLDTPGILWPKFDCPQVGLHLAYTGAVKDTVLDTETLGCCLAAYLAASCPQALTEHYKLPSLPQRDGGEDETAYGLRLLEAAGRTRGFLISGGAVDTQRMAAALLDGFRAGKLGRITLERPE